MYLHQAIDQVNASASPSDWLAWCSDWGCWKPVTEAAEFSAKLQMPKGVAALPSRKQQSFPLEMKLTITCEGEIFKTKTTDIGKHMLDIHDEAPRKFFQEPCEFELSYMVGPENRKMRFKGRMLAEGGQKKKLSLKEVPSHVRDFVANCLSSVEYTQAAPQHQQAA
jgi:hypothetical protein